DRSRPRARVLHDDPRGRASRRASRIGDLAGTAPWRDRRSARPGTGVSGDNLTILVALAAGLISFLSPCVLPLVPAYLGQLSAIAVAGGGLPRPGRCLAVRHAIAFVVGFTAVFALLGLTATYLAQGLVDILPLLRVVGGATLIVLGLSLAGILHIPALERTWRPLDAGAAGSLATTTGSIALSTG